MGVIDWEQKGDEIKRFIQACSKPYSGAFCSIIILKKKVKIKIFEAEFFKIKKLPHPSLNGKVFYEDESLIKVLVKNGYLKILKKNILLEGYMLNKFEGKTFFSSNEDILKAKIFIPNVFKYK